MKYPDRRVMDALEGRKDLVDQRDHNEASSQVVELVVPQQYTGKKWERFRRPEHSEMAQHSTLFLVLRIRAHPHQPVRDSNKDQCIVDRGSNNGSEEITARLQLHAVVRGSNITTR